VRRALFTAEGTETAKWRDAAWIWAAFFALWEVRRGSSFTTESTEKEKSDSSLRSG
jgi:hypothetical protein